MTKKLIKISILSIIIILNLLFSGCSSNRYIQPKGVKDKLVLEEADKIMKNVAKTLSQANRQKLQKVEIYLNKKSFAVTSNDKKNKLLLPAQGYLDSFYELNQDSFLESMCHNDLNCKEKLITYSSSYFLLHELYHIINSDNYKSKNSKSLVKDPNSKGTMMSFNEEIAAESIVIKYLLEFEPLLLQEYETLFSKILNEKNYDMNSENVKRNWNSYQLNNFKQINNTRLYFFIYTKEQLGNKSLEELLFDN